MDFLKLCLCHADVTGKLRVWTPDMAEVCVSILVQTSIFYTHSYS